MSGREEIESRKDELLALCHEHRVARLQVFGSVLRDDFNPETSDIDLLVDFLPGTEKPWMGEYLDLKQALEGLFSRKVDLISSGAIRNPYVLRYVDREKETLYAA